MKIHLIKDKKTSEYLSIADNGVSYWTKQVCKARIFFTKVAVKNALNSCVRGGHSLAEYNKAISAEMEIGAIQDV